MPIAPYNFLYNLCLFVRGQSKILGDYNSFSSIRNDHTQLPIPSFFLLEKKKVKTFQTMKQMQACTNNGSIDSFS